MSKELSSFTPLSGFDDVFSATKGNLRCSAIRLRSGGLCLYSPVQGLGKKAQDSLASLGKITHLLAPNHYHHKGLAEYADAFPTATICCTKAANPRLLKQTGLSIVPLQHADLDIHESARLIEPEGLKTGEIWIELSTGDQCLWIVTDAFCGPDAAKNDISDRVELLKPFPTYGIEDLQRYSDWLCDASQTSKPTALLPCHGAIVSKRGLATDVVNLVTKLG